MMRLEDLGTRCCRYSVDRDEGGQFFCGEVTDSRQSFCAKHRIIVSSPSTVPLHAWIRNTARFDRVRFSTKAAKG